MSNNVMRPNAGLSFGLPAGRGSLQKETPREGRQSRDAISGGAIHIMLARDHHLSSCAQLGWDLCG